MKPKIKGFLYVGCGLLIGYLLGIGTWKNVLVFNTERELQESIQQAIESKGERLHDGVAFTRTNFYARLKAEGSPLLLQGVECEYLANAVVNASGNIVLTPLSKLCENLETKINGTLIYVSPSRTKMTILGRQFVELDAGTLVNVTEWK